MQTDILNNKNLQIFGAVALILYTIGIITAWNTPVSGYEPSIYAATPIIFWIGIISTYIIGTLIVALHIIRGKTSSFVNILGYILLCLSSLSLISIGIIRGNILYGITDDVGSHIGVLKTLLETGIIASYYPSIYTGSAASILLSGLDVFTTMALYPVFYLGIFILGAYLLAKEIFPNRKTAVLVLLICLYLPIGTAPYISPYYPLLFIGMQSTIRLIPILLYLVIKTCKTHSKALFVTTGVLCVSLVFYHPMASLLVLFLFGSILLFNILNKIIYKEWKIYDIKLSFLMILTVGALFFLWSWKQFGSQIATGVLSLLTVSEADLSERNAGELLSFASDAAGYGFDVLTILQMGAINLFIYLCLVIGGLYYLLRCFKQNKGQYLGYLYAYVGLLGVATLAFMVMNIGFKYSRFLDEIYLGGIISAGLILYLVLKEIRRHSAKESIVSITIIICILMAVCGVSVATVHPSPTSLSGGAQTTQQEYVGVETIITLIDYNKNSTGIHMTGLQRYVSAIYGSERTVGSNKYGNNIIISTERSGTEYSKPVPYHFGYDTGMDSLNELYENGDTVFIIEKDKQYYQAYYPELIADRWGQQDFKQLEMDKGLDKVYNNMGMEIYQIK